MRLLLTGQPIYSHLVPAMVPLARAALAAGHEAAIATAGSVAEELARHGVPHLPLPNVFSLARLRGDPDLSTKFGLPQRVLEPGRRTADPAVPVQIARAFAGPIALAFARDLLDVAEHWRPDVIVHEPAALGGYLAAQRLGIPHATLDISPFALRELPHVHDVLNAQRLALGMAPIADVMHPHQYLRIGLVPRSWYPPELRLPTGRYYHLRGNQEKPLPDEYVGDRGGDRPLVLASLGSLALSLPGLDDLLDPLVAALGRLRCDAVLSLGGLDHLASRLGSVPSNVRVALFVAQQRLLEACDLFVTHAGFGSVRDAMICGVPMVALPTISDGPANGARIGELGLGECLDIETLTQHTLIEACERVLAEPRYRARAREMRGEMMASPDVDVLLNDLAALAARRGIAPMMTPGS